MSPTCSRCGHALTAGAKFCRACGSPVVGEPEAREDSTEAGVEKGAGLVCSACGRALAPGTKFCRGCGAPVPDQGPPSTAVTKAMDQSAPSSVDKVQAAAPQSLADGPEAKPTAKSPARREQETKAVSGPVDTPAGSSGAKPPPPPTLASRKPGAPPPQREPKRGIADQAGRRRTVLIALISVGALLVGGGAYAVVRLTSGGGSADRQTVASSPSFGSPSQTSAPTSPPAPPTQYAVVYQITPTGDICKPGDLKGVAEELLRTVRQDGANGRITRSDAYPSEGSGGWCVEEGQYGSRSAAEAALRRASTKVPDQKLIQDGKAASVVRVRPGYESPTLASAEANHGGGGSSKSGPYAGAMATFERYWREIDAGDYGAAYKLYYPGFNSSESDFVAAENAAKPDIAMDTLKMTPRTNNGSVVTLNASLILRDRSGQYAGQCRLLSGWVRFEQGGSGWLYRPGSVNGEVPSFAQAPKALNSDPSCP